MTRMQTCRLTAIKTIPVNTAQRESDILLSSCRFLIDYYHNEVLSLSAFVGGSDQSLDIVLLTIKAKDQIDDTI